MNDYTNPTQIILRKLSADTNDIIARLKIMPIIEAQIMHIEKITASDEPIYDITSDAFFSMTSPDKEKHLHQLRCRLRMYELYIFEQDLITEGLWS